MPLSEVLRLAFEALVSHKFRTVLTMLGMIIGVFAVVLLVSLGEGARTYILSEFRGLGTNLIVVQPGKTDERGTFAHPVGSAATKMTLADITAIEKRALNVDAVTGLVLATAKARYEDAVSNINVFGANNQFPRIITMVIGEGNFFTREEDEYGRRVVVLGVKVARNLFGNEYAVGRLIKLNDSEFRVIGVLAPMGEKLGLNLDYFACIPTTAALKLFNENKLFGIRARASSKSGVDDAVEEIRTILKERREGEEDFTIVTQAAMMESMNTILNMLTYVLAAIAAISMLVGGIGIMNIMLVSVSERTQEIGIRRAVGARRIDVLMQFISEAVALSLSSGLIGLALAIGLTYALRLFVTSFDMRPPLWILPPAFLLSIVIGVVFGVWPAAKASRIETLDALRHE